MGFFKTLTAIPGFFVTSLILKGLSTPVARHTGLEG